MGSQQLLDTAKNMTLTSKLVLIVVSIMLAPCARSFEIEQPLVDVKWLQANIDRVRVLDIVLEQQEFVLAGHIPSAVPVPWGWVRRDDFLDGKIVEKLLPVKEDFEELMRTSGVDNESAVVISFAGTGSRSMAAGARLYWQMKYYGHDNVALLDGGNAAWSALTGEQLSHDTPAEITQGNFSVRRNRDELLATTHEMVQATSDDAVQILDTRSLPYYLGIVKKPYVKNSGHIPAAKLFPHTLLTEDEAPSRVVTLDTIVKASDLMAVDLHIPTIVYCNSGHLASATWYVLHELLGNKNVRLYDGSMHEWTTTSPRPVLNVQNSKEIFNYMR